MGRANACYVSASARNAIMFYRQNSTLSLKFFDVKRCDGIHILKLRLT